MKKILFSLGLLMLGFILFSSLYLADLGTLIPYSDQRKSIENKKINVKINTTIETFMILRSLSESDPLFKYRKSDYKGKPIMFKARRYFADYKNHNAVKETQNFLNSTSSSGDLILEGLLHYNELPNPKLKFKIVSEDWKHRQDSLNNYLNILDSFYKEAKVDEFIDSHIEFYNGAMKEAESYLNPKLIPTLEEYFGQKNEAYNMVLIPNAPFGMGFGAGTKSEKGDTYYQIIAPANDVEWNDTSTYTSFGYSGEDAEEYYRDLVVHEFCHPFITPFIQLEEWSNRIAETDSLFIPKLDSIMSEQGYNSWWGFVNEHLVRATEIRIASKMGTEDIQNMRNYNIHTNGFVLIPEAEELLIKYENNRDEYENFREFIPLLIEQLGTYNRRLIEEKLKHH